MKLFGLLLPLLVVAAFADDSSSSEEEDELPLAQPCDPELCKIPDCRCSNTEIPGGLAPRDTPQFVMVTYDDGVNVLNIETYREVLYNRINKGNDCPARATYFINHEYTNYQLVNELYNNGFEIALHSVTHRTPQTYWAEATYEDMVKEFAEQKYQMSHFANIPIDELKGIRIPFLQLSGNASFLMLKNHGFTYDSTWPTITHLNPGMWPYTLDYASTQDCGIPPCPTASIPGVWVSPMVSWLDVQGNPCAMVDACIFPPDLEDEEAWLKFIIQNFERHYMGNRAPFGFYSHEWYLSAYPAVKRALVRFLDMINGLNDVYMVTLSEVIEWTKNPSKIDEYRTKPCRQFVPTSCPAQSCTLLSQHNLLTYWMQVCSVCPNTYPWIGNALGE